MYVSTENYNIMVTIENRRRQHKQKPKPIFQYNARDAGQPDSGGNHCPAGEGSGCCAPHTLRTLLVPQLEFNLATARIRNTSLKTLDGVIRAGWKRVLGLPSRASAEVVYILPY